MNFLSDDDPCHTNNPCKNGATCYNIEVTDTMKVPACKCAPGYEVPHCDVCKSIIISLYPI